MPRRTNRIECEEGLLVRELRGRGWWAYPAVYHPGHDEPVALVKAGSPRKFFKTRREAMGWLVAFAEDRVPWPERA